MLDKQDQKYKFHNDPTRYFAMQKTNTSPTVFKATQKR